MQEDAERKTKERIAGQQVKFRELKEALDKVIKTFNKDAEVMIILYKHMHNLLFVYRISLNMHNDSYKYVYVTVSAKTVLNGTFSIMRKTDLKY